MPLWFLIPAFFLVAICYSSVGLGGGTAYLAVLSFFSGDPALLRPTAWSLNVLATSIGFRNFQVQGHFRPREAWPWLAGGILGASLGAMCPLEPEIFRGLLGATLTAVAVHMILSSANWHVSNDCRTIRKPAQATAIVLGIAVGMVSGVVGIGGGIILGPIILTFKYADPKSTAALTSVYILLSSAAALSSYVVQGGAVDLRLIFLTGIAVLVGSFLGSRFGATRASSFYIRRMFGVLVLVAGAKLLLGTIAAIR